MTIEFGTSRADTLTGSNSNDILYGGAGHDLIRSFVGDIREAYDDAADLLFGGAGNDSIASGAGSDVVFGGAGRDTIDGGRDVDYLVGGAGRDTFAFDVIYASPGSPSPDTGVGEDNRDVILDFRQGTDKIDLRGWENDYIGVLGADFVGNDQGLSVDLSDQLQVGFRYEGGHTIVELWRGWAMLQPEQLGMTYASPTGEIEIAGRVDLTASDFIFST